MPDLQAPLLQSESVDQRISPTTSAIDQPADQVHDQKSNTPDSDAEDQYEDAEQEFRVSRWFRLLAHADVGLTFFFPCLFLLLSSFFLFLFFFFVCLFIYSNVMNSFAISCFVVVQISKSYFFLFFYSHVVGIC